MLLFMAHTPSTPMSEQQLKAFWEATQADPALKQKLQGVTGLSGVVDIAKEAGFTISVEELEKAQAELSEDEQLSGAAGGICVIFTHR